MTAQSLANVALKVLGIYWIVASLMMLPSLAMYSAVSVQGQNVSPSSYLGFQLAMIVIPFSIGLGFLLATNWIVRLFFREPQGEELRASSVALQAVGLSVVGAGFFISGAARLASSIAILVATSSPHPRFSPPPDFFPRRWETMAMEVVLTASGLLLFFAARRLAEYWHRKSGFPIDPSRG